MLAAIRRAFAISVCCAISAAAQPRATPSGIIVTAAPPSIRQLSELFGPQERAQSKEKRAPLIAPIASLVIPGAGQGMMRQTRALGYLVAEGFLAIRASRADRDKSQARAGFRSIAANVARAGFGTVRPNGPWEYYETLEKVDASGAFDLAVAGKFTPETDVSTYNGAQWQQARSTYWLDPDVQPAESSTEYKNALAFYKSRAVQGSFRWTWFDHKLEQAAYVQTIKEANSSKQQYVSDVGLIVANHLVSMIDAYINVRLRKYGGAGLGANLSLQIQPMGRFPEREFGSVLTLSMPMPRR